MKIASIFRFDERFNNLTFNELNSNVISLSQTNDGDSLPVELDFCSSDDLHFINTPFKNTSTKIVEIKWALIIS